MKILNFLKSRKEKASESCNSEALHFKRVMGFEPTTSTLARLRSTTELHPQNLRIS
jgi:hypothetical protein